MPTPDRKQFEHLVRMHHAAVFRAARRVVQDEAAAADVVQEVFLRVLSGKECLGTARQPRAILCWLATRLAANAHRAERRRSNHEVTAMRSDPELHHRHSPDPVAVAARRELGRVLQQTVDALPPELRTPLLLRYQDGLTLVMVGSALRLPTSTVHARVGAALQRLRGALEGRCLGAAVAAWPEWIARLPVGPVPSGLEARLMALTKPVLPFVVGGLRRLMLAGVAAMTTGLAVAMPGWCDEQPASLLANALSSGDPGAGALAAATPASRSPQEARPAPGPQPPASGAVTPPPAVRTRAQATPPTPMRDTFGSYVMLAFPRIREQLKITPEQGRQLDAVLAQTEGPEAGPVVALLSPEQREQFLVFSARCFGGYVCADPTWAARLGVSPELQTAIHASVAKALQGMRIGSKAGCASFDDVRKVMFDFTIREHEESLRELILPHLKGFIDFSIFNDPARVGARKPPTAVAGAEEPATGRGWPAVMPLAVTTEELRARLANQESAWIDGNSVVFVFEGEATSVRVHGFYQSELSLISDLQRVPGADHLWALRLPVDRAAELVLGYALGKKQRGTESRQPHRVLRGPKAPPALAAVDPSRLSGTITTHSLRSTIFAAERRVRVYMPSIGQSGGKPGLTMFATDGEIEAYARHLEPLMADGSLPPVAIVAVTTGGGHEPGSAAAGAVRSREYLPWNEWMGGQDEGDFDRHLRWVADEVVPWAESQFGIGGSRERRIVQGYSNGAVFAAHAVVMRADVFGRAIVNSMGLPCERGKPTQPIAVYCQAGTLEPGFLSATKGFVAKLAEWQVPHHFVERVGAHDDEIWSEEVAKALLWLTSR